MTSSQKNICSQCWAENESDAVHCAVCQAALIARPEMAAAAIVETTPPVAPAYHSGDLAGRINPLPGPQKTAWEQVPGWNSHQKSAPSIFQQIFRPEVDENAPKPYCVLEKQGISSRLPAALIDLFLIALFSLFWPFWVHKVSGDTVLWYGQLIGGLVFACVYATSLTASAHQATLGQSMMGIVVVDQQGRKLSLLSALMRSILWLVSLASGIGVLLILFPAKKALHDWLSRTQVVKPVWMVDLDGQAVPYRSKKQDWFSVLR